MAADKTGAKSSATADSYIGSLISLITKSDIRYEGIVYKINTDEASIRLQNVRSYGTEGRRKDGPQIPPYDNVHDYILFRGTDIKDLEVKASPPAKPAPTINNDPAIIQYHYPNQMPTSSSLPPTVSGSLPNIGSYSGQRGQHGMGFQSGLPLYQPGGNLGSWGAAASPQPPMYWPGLYTPPPNDLPQLHQQSLLRPPNELSMPTSLQQPLQYPSFNPPLATVSSVLQGSALSEAPSSLYPFSTNSQILAPSSMPSFDLPVSLPSGVQTSFPPAPSLPLASELSPHLLSYNSPIAATPTLTQDTSLAPISLSTTNATETSDGLPLSNKSSGSFSLPKTVASAPFIGASSSITQDMPKPSLITPGQLLQSGSGAVSFSKPSPNTAKDVKVVQVSSSAGREQSASNTSEPQPPILPLPASAKPAHKSQPNVRSFPAHNGYRGRGSWRGRGRRTGRAHLVTKFTEDFDFTAMNEKFNKDEVWGHLGKNTKGDSDEDDDSPIEDEAELPKVESKPVYNKDDFFDSLSSNASNRDSQNSRPRFSEQRKLDTETFGEYSSFIGGGRGYGRHGYYSRGGYNGRGYNGGRGGYGYSGRGHGRGVSNRRF